MALFLNILTIGEPLYDAIALIEGTNTCEVTSYGRICCKRWLIDQKRLARSRAYEMWSENKAIYNYRLVRKQNFGP